MHLKVILGLDISRFLIAIVAQATAGLFALIFYCTIVAG